MITRLWVRSHSSSPKEQLISISRFASKTFLVMTIALPPLVLASGAQAENGVEIQLSYKDKKFDPAEIGAPANTPITIKFRNLDNDAMELESDALHIE
jgi:hypothetical protein